MLRLRYSPCGLRLAPAPRPPPQGPAAAAMPRSPRSGSTPAAGNSTRPRLHPAPFRTSTQTRSSLQLLRALVQLSIANFDDAVRDGREPRVVRGHHGHDAPRLGRGANQLGDLRARHAIERGSRLLAQQDTRSLHHPPPYAANPPVPP